MARIFDHVDLRVASLATVTPFYSALLPMLGFSRQVKLDGWLQFEAAGDGPSEFFGIAEERAHVPNATRIAFWADSKARVDELSAILPQIGARNVEGPDFESDEYYAVYFEDPAGNRLEICHRLRRFANA